MKRLKDWVKRLSIRKKLVFYTYLVITPILLLISGLLFFRNYSLAVEEEEYNCLQSIERLSDSFEVMQKNIMEMGTYICINNEITQILTSNAPEELNSDAQLWLHRAPLQMIQDMVAIDGQIKTVAIYPENGVEPYLRCMDYSSYIGDIETVRNEDIYKLAVQEKGSFLWQRVGKYQSDTYQFNQNDKIVMYREIYDLARKNKLGYLVIGSSAGSFDRMCQNSLRNEDEAVIAMSEYGAILVNCGNMDEEFLTEAVSKLSGQGKKNAMSGGYDYQDYRVYWCKSEETGTILYKIVPKVTMLDYVDTIIIVPLALLLGVLVGLYPVMVLVSNIVSKPLHTLGIAMQNFKRGDFSQKVDVMTFDEVGEASACFNGMVDDIRDLINKNYVMALKERESELDVLQAQINPHFLYNTLDSLYWKAIEAGDEEIAEDIYSLSQLFRLVLSRGNSIVTVRNEAELLERYLHIQKMRFGKRLEYKIWLNESILDEEIPKLIVQPFVENAIVHGFEQGECSFYLSIIGEKADNYMVFCIRDTGVGMSAEQLAAIWNTDETKTHSSQQIGKYAIKNVKERLALIYHDDYKLDIESREGQGTTVKIVVPCGLKELRLHEHKTVDCG